MKDIIRLQKKLKISLLLPCLFIIATPGPAPAKNVDSSSGVQSCSVMHLCCASNRDSYCDVQRPCRPWKQGVL